MSHNQIIALLCLAALLLYVISCIKKRPSSLLVILGRGAGGLAYIHAFNVFCLSRGIITYVNVNVLTAGISACLGIPGVLLAYSLRLLRFL